MGVQGLLQLLKSIQRPCHVKSFAGLTLGIDAYCWLHPGTIPCAVAIATGKHTTRYVDYVMHRIRMLQHYGVTPYVVFDGNYLPSKASTEAKRAESRAAARQKGLELLKLGRTTEAHNQLQRSIDVTPEMARHLMDELDKLNIKYVVAPYEADAQLAYLEREGIISGIISEDSDLLVFGARKLITKLDKFGECVEIHRDDFTSCRSVSFVGWTDDMFRRMAILTGCDYIGGLPQMGLKTAHSLVRRYKDLEKILRAIQFAGKIRVPKDYAENFKNAEYTFCHQWVFCPSRQKLVMGTEWPVDQRPGDISFIGQELENAVAAGVAHGRLHPMTKLPLRSPRSSPKGEISSAKKSYIQRNQIISTPSDLKGQKKPIDSFFKPKRTPLAELDPNCFTPSPSQDELLRRHPGSVSSTPVDENNSPIQSFRATESTGRSTGRARQTRDHLGLAAGSQTVPNAAKRKRLCDDSPKKGQTAESSTDDSCQSRFFANKAPEPSPSLKRQVRHKKKIQNFSIHSDGSPEALKSSLPDPTDMAPPSTPKMAVFQDTSAKLAEAPIVSEETFDSTQSTASLSASSSTLSSTLTEATSLSFTSSTSLGEKIDRSARKELDEIKETLSRSRANETHDKRVAPKQTLFAGKSALQRLGRQAIQRSQSMPTFDIPAEPAISAVEGAVDDFQEPSTLPDWQFGPRAARIASLAEKTSIAPAITQGSEDLIVPKSEDDLPEEHELPKATTVNLGRFVFDG